MDTTLNRLKRKSYGSKIMAQSDFELIEHLERQIRTLQQQIKEIRVKPQWVSKGDKVKILRDYEWVCGKGTIMEVDTVSAGHIHCRYLGKGRKSGFFWISDGDYVKVEE